HGREGDMMLVLCHHLLVTRPGPHSSRAAVEAHMPVRRVILHGVVVHVVHEGRPNMYDGAVVVEPAAAPIPADEPGAVISIPVVDSAVEPHVRSPIARVPEIGATLPAPIAGRPEKPYQRRQNPCSRHPVVPAIVPGPVTGRPHVPRLRARWLHVYRQSRRRNVYRDADENTGGRYGREGRQHESGNEATKDSLAHEVLR